MTKKRVETTMDFLGSLAEDTGVTKQFLPISSITSDPDQPRKTFDQEALDSLAAAIKSDGILQPLLVRETGGEPPYIITDGERRWRAAQVVGLDEVPCLIRNDIDSNRIRFVQAMANVNREALTDFELAMVIRQQLDENPKLKQKDMAKLLGISAPTVTRLLAMLAPEFFEMSRDGLFENASVLAQFKKLEEDAKNKLITAAQSGEVITREAIEKLKTEAAVRASENLPPPQVEGSAAKDSSDGKANQQPEEVIPDDEPSLEATKSEHLPNEEPPPKKAAQAIADKKSGNVSDIRASILDIIKNIHAIVPIQDVVRQSDDMPFGFYIDFPEDIRLFEGKMVADPKLRMSLWKLLVSVSGQIDHRISMRLPDRTEMAVFVFSYDLVKDRSLFRAAFERHGIPLGIKNMPLMEFGEISMLFADQKLSSLVIHLLESMGQIRSLMPADVPEGFQGLFGA